MTLTPLGDTALVISLSEQIDDSALNRTNAVAEALRMARLEAILDVVPAFSTVTVYYDVSRTNGFAAFEARLEEIVTRATESIVRAQPGNVVEIPLCYGGTDGPDLELVATRASARLDQVIEWHSAPEYRVHAIGFVPGFAYLGGLPKRLHTPRRSTPRPVVAAGSVAIGGAQTGIYPMATPGGWNVIGRTPLRVFDLNRARPALLHAGDRVKFRSISPEEFSAWK